MMKRAIKFFDRNKKYCEDDCMRNKKSEFTIKKEEDNSEKTVHMEKSI